MKILLLAGEESGLIYANRLRERLADCEIRSYADYGFKTSDLAVMGFAAVLRRIGFFLEVKKTMERAIDEWRPDVVCTIDYPGMNLKLSAYAKARGIRTLHIVCPQVWAWRSGRIPKIEASTDALCCFLPFEPGLFRPGFAKYVGHPLAEDFKACGTAGDLRPSDLRPSTNQSGNVKLAILPGSRIGEIERNLPVLLDAAELLGPGVEVAVPAANPGAAEAIGRIAAARGAERGGLKITLHPVGSARKLLQSATCAAVASGTATLEAALARCPTVLVYRVSAALAWFARRVIKGVGHIGLANILWEKSGGAGEAPMPELLQENFTARNVAKILRAWLDDPAARNAAAQRLDMTVGRLETDGSAFAKMAAMIKRRRTMKIDRRRFIGAAAAAALAQSFPSWAEQAAKGAAHPLAGKPLHPWTKGSTRIKIHYTGRSESTFIIFPDSTSVLIDCGEYEYRNSGMPFLPSPGMLSGEAICRDILRENPNGKKVDYFVLSHYHSDHAGSIKGLRGNWPRSADGSHALCGVGKAIDMLDFGKMIDRSWPDMQDPAPRSDSFDGGVVKFLRETYREAERRGIKVERFRLEKGSDQIKLLHGGCKGFAFTPLTGRGLILRRDGSVFDLGALKGAPGDRSKFPENPLSTGMVFSIGDFRYYTAGDFEDPAFEKALSKECPAVDVAKCNHHATNTMDTQLVKALDASLWLTGGCWHPAHTGRAAMRRMKAGWRPESVVAPGYFPAARRKNDAKEPWLGNLAKESWKPCHVVVDVAPGGASYTLAMVDAGEENGKVLGAYDFKTTRKQPLG